jgi:hypothetical protein
MLIRLEALELSANAGDADASDRFALHVIQVKGDGSVAVTDGTQLLRIHAAVTEPGLFDALLPVEECGYDEDVLIDASDARDFKAACKKALQKAGKKSVADGGEPVHVVVAKADDTMTLATADGVVERRFIIKQQAEPKYPDVERLIPTGDTRDILVSVDLLLKMLRTLKPLRVRAVKLGITKDPMAAIKVSATSMAGEIDGALMPMRDVEKDDAKTPKVDASTGEIQSEGAGVH